MHKIIGYIVLVIFLILAYAKYIEFTSVFFPTKILQFTPAIVNIKFEDIYIQAQDGIKINGWFIPNLQDDPKYTLLLLHGNAGNISDRLEKIRILNELGFNVFIIDYRGYGRSQGMPSEKGMYLDARAAYEYLLKARGVAADMIILYGESLGVAAAVDLASRAKVGAVILEGGFSSGKDMAKAVYPYIPNFLFSDKFNSLGKIKDVAAPKLFLHSPDDEIVPFKLANKLFSSAPYPKYFTRLKGNHNNSFIDYPQEYSLAIRDFMDRF